MASEFIEERRGEIFGKVAETDREFVERSVGVLIGYFERSEEKPEECTSGGNVCRETILNECVGMFFMNEARIRQVLDVLSGEGLLKREISGGTRIPRYPPESLEVIFSNV